MSAASTDEQRRSRRNGRRGPSNADAVLAAAHRLVRERGESFTTQDLIKEADVSLDTFYKYFGGKDQLLVAVLGDLVGGHCRRLDERAAAMTDPIARLRFFITETLAVAAVNETALAVQRFVTSQHWRLHQVDPDGLHEATRGFADLVERELERGNSTGALASVDPERDAWIINKVVMGTFHHYVFVDGDAPATIVDDVVRFAFRAVDVREEGSGSGATRATSNVRRRRDARELSSSS